MVILEPDGTLTHAEPHPRARLDFVADLLSHEGEPSGVSYAFDVVGLGTVALHIEAETSSGSGEAPRRFGPIVLGLR